MKANYKIKKVLNNNSLLISDRENEMIIIGKGIGFNRSVGQLLGDDILYEKEYHLLGEQDYQNQSQVPKDIIKNTAAIVNIVDNHIEKEIPEQSLKSLTNHVAAMLVRLENGEIFPNPFHHETVTLYGDSYEIAMDVAQEVKQDINLLLPEAEVDFLTLYIHGINSSFDRKDAILRNAIISDVSETIEHELGIELNKSSVFYARFITHLKFLIERITRDEEVEAIPLVESIGAQFPEYMEMSGVIVKVLEKHLKQKLSQDEQTYIALHLARLTIKEDIDYSKRK